MVITAVHQQNLPRLATRISIRGMDHTLLRKSALQAAPLRIVAVAVELVEVRQQAVVLRIRLEHQMPDLPSHQQDSVVRAVMLQLGMEKSHCLQAVNPRTASGSDGYPTQSLAHL